MNPALSYAILIIVTLGALALVIKALTAEARLRKKYAEARAEKERTHAIWSANLAHDLAEAKKLVQNLPDDPTLFDV